MGKGREDVVRNMILDSEIGTTKTFVMDWVSQHDKIGTFAMGSGELA